MDKAAKIKLAIAVVVLIGAIVLLLNYLGVFSGGPQAATGADADAPQNVKQLKVTPGGN